MINGTAWKRQQAMSKKTCSIKELERNTKAVRKQEYIILFHKKVRAMAKELQKDLTRVNGQ